MDIELLKILSDELRETRLMVIETRRTADAAQRRADASWEFVIMTKNQLEEQLRILKLPWWRKLMGNDE